MELGQIVITANAKEVIDNYSILKGLGRYSEGDWGEVSDEDWQANDEAGVNADRVLAAYRDSNGEKFWIITEWDRSVTTILLPEDY